MMRDFFREGRNIDTARRCVAPEHKGQKPGHDALLILSRYFSGHSCAGRAPSLAGGVAHRRDPRGRVVGLPPAVFAHRARGS